MVFRKKLEFFEIPQGGKFAVECVLIGIISLKCHFHPTHEVFFNKKSENFERGKN